MSAPVGGIAVGTPVPDTAPPPDSPVGSPTATGATTLQSSDYVDQLGQSPLFTGRGSAPPLPPPAAPISAEQVGVAIMELQTKASSLQMDSVKGTLDGVSKMQKGLNAQALQKDTDAADAAAKAAKEDHKKSIWSWIAKAATTLVSVVVAAATMNPAAIVMAVQSIVDLTLQALQAAGVKMPESFGDPPTMMGMITAGVAGILKDCGVSDKIAGQIANGIVAAAGVAIAIGSGNLMSGGAALSMVTGSVAKAASDIALAAGASPKVAGDIGMAVGIMCTVVAIGAMIKGDPGKLADDTSVMQKLKNFVAEAKDFASKLPNMMEPAELAASGARLGEQIGSSVADMVQSMQDFNVESEVRSLAEAIKSSATDVSKAMNDMASDFSTGVKNLPQDMISGLRNTVSELQNMASDVANIAKNIRNMSAQDVMAALTKMLSDLKAMPGNLATNFRSLSNLEKAKVITQLAGGLTSGTASVGVGTEGIKVAKFTEDESTSAGSAKNLQTQSSAMNGLEKSLFDSIRDISKALDAMLEKANEILKNDSSTRLQLAHMDRLGTA